MNIELIDTGALAELATQRVFGGIRLGKTATSSNAIDIKDTVLGDLEVKGTLKLKGKLSPVGKASAEATDAIVAIRFDAQTLVPAEVMVIPSSAYATFPKVTSKLMQANRQGGLDLTSPCIRPFIRPDLLPAFQAVVKALLAE